MSRKETTLTLALPLLKSEAACLQACQQFARQIGWECTKTHSSQVVCKEPFKLLSFTNPITIEVDLRSLSDTTTTVQIVGANTGFGPLQSRHVEKHVATLAMTIEQAATHAPSPFFAPPRSQPQPSTSQPRQKNRRIFISYRRGDSADVTGRIYDRLVQQFGKEAIFKDVDSIPLGVDFRVHLDEAVGKCDVLLAVIGDQWLTATDSQGRRRLDATEDFVRIEIEAALERNIPVIPLLVEHTSMPTEDALPQRLKLLAFRNGTPVRPDPDFHNDMARLIAALQRHLNS